MLCLHSKIEICGINPYVLIGAREAARLKKHWRKPMPVYLQVEGELVVPWRTNLMPRGNGSFWLYLPQVVRKASGTAVGDTVGLRLRFDQDYRGGPMHPMPRWFDAGLRENGAARAGWERLAPSRQKEILRYFAGLKTSQAQARNLHRAVRALAGAKARFMARDWNR